MGISRVLISTNRPRFIALEPTSSPVLTTGEKGSSGVVGKPRQWRFRIDMTNPSGQGPLRDAWTQCVLPSETKP